MNLPLVSIIMPAYNSANYIGESIESVIAQTYNNWELIVIDDGSTDSTAEVVNSYCIKDKRIKYLWQQNGRQGKARNNGIKKAAGEYIAFLDSDDLWMPNKLEVQLVKLQSTNYDLVFSDAYVFLVSPVNYNLKTLLVQPKEYKGEEGIIAFFNGNKIPILTVLVRKEVLITVSGFTEDSLIQNAEDYHLWLKLLIKGYTFCSFSQPLAAYRIHSDSATNNFNATSLNVIAALADISNCYPKYKEVIKAKIKSWTKVSLEYLRITNNIDFRFLIKRNLTESGYKKYVSTILIVEKILNRNSAIRLAYFLLNYL